LNSLTNTIVQSQHQDGVSHGKAGAQAGIHQQIRETEESLATHPNQSSRNDQQFNTDSKPGYFVKDLQMTLPANHMANANYNTLQTIGEQ